MMKSVRLPLNWRSLMAFAWSALGLEMILLATVVGSLLLGPRSALSGDDRSLLLLFFFMLLVPSAYLFAYGAISRWDCSESGLTVRGLTGKSETIPWERIQAVEQSSSRVRILLEDERPILIPRVFKGYSAILYWLDRLSPASAPVLQPVIPHVRPTEQRVFRLRSIRNVWLISSALVAIGAGGVYAASAVAAHGKWPLLIGATFAAAAIATLVGGLNKKIVVNEGALTVYPAFGQPYRVPLDKLVRIAKETDDAVEGSRRQDLVLFFEDDALLIHAHRTWTRAFLGAIVREAGHADLIDYTEDPMTIRYSVILL